MENQTNNTNKYKTWMTFDLTEFGQNVCRSIPPLPGLTKNGRRVVVMKGVDLEHVAASVADAMKAVLMIGDIRLKEEQIGVAGDVYILDASVATPQNFAQHFAKFTPALLKKFFICVQVNYTYKLCSIGQRPLRSLSLFRVKSCDLRN